MSMVHKCDRCGRYFDDDFLRIEKQIGSCLEYTSNRYDLCERCSKDFDTFMNMNLGKDATSVKPERKHKWSIFS